MEKEAIEFQSEAHRELSRQVVIDLRAQRAIGVKIPDRAIAMAQNPELIADFGEMSVTELADLIKDLASC